MNGELSSLKVLIAADSNITMLTKNGSPALSLAIAFERNKKELPSNLI